MNAQDFHTHYLPAVLRYLDIESLGIHKQHNVDDYLEVSQNEFSAILLFLEKEAGRNKFLDILANYEDAREHNFPNIQGISHEQIRSYLLTEISLLIHSYNIPNAGLKTVVCHKIDFDKELIERRLL